MKKIFALLLALMLLVSITACGDEPAAAETAAPAESTATEATQAPQIDGDVISTEFWSLTYSEDWTVDEDGVNASEGSYASVTLSIPDPDGDYSLVSVYIEASIEDPDDFRDMIKGADMDAYDLIENGNASYTNIGGVDCLSHVGSYWGDDCQQYFGRVEGAGATVLVRIVGAYEDERVASLLSTLTFTLTDEGKVDPPWSWNGTPFTCEPKSAMGGTVTLSSEQLPLAESLIVDDIFSGRIAVSGSDVYVLLDKALHVYSFDGSSLTYSNTITLDDDYKEMTSCEDGIVYLSNFGSDLIGIQNGTVVCSYADTKYVAMHPSGSWGISYFTSNEVEKISISDGIKTAEPMTLAEIKMINSVSINQNHILISGSSVANEEHAIFVYDFDGNLLLTLGDKDFGEPDSLGSVTCVIENENGYFALDGNMRSIMLWNSNGEFISEIDDSDLFGTNYPWMSAAAALSDGSKLIGMTEERTDKSADEFVIFHVSGF